MIDPLGFALENFDVIGGWRTIDESGKPVDASGSTVSGQKIEGLAGLRSLLLDQPEQFPRTVTEKLLAYALGRRVEYYDEPAVRKIDAMPRPRTTDGLRSSWELWRVLLLKETRMTFLTKSLPRRTILRGMGAALALPFLDAMLPTLRAATKPSNRFLTFYTPNGMAMEYWTVKGEGTAFELSPILEPLAPFREQMIVLSGIKSSWNYIHAGASGCF